jgi:hypothetical protein
MLAPKYFHNHMEISPMPNGESARFSIPFSNDGGPLLALPRELLPYWRGIHRDADGNGADVESESFAGTDYDRACATGEMIAVITIGPGAGIVLGADDLAHGVRWARVPPRGTNMLVVPVYSAADYRDVLPHQLRTIGDSGWRLVYPSFHVSSGDMLLMHAADCGSEIIERESGEYATGGEAIPWRIGTGTYALDERTIELQSPIGESLLILGRFRPI